MTTATLTCNGNGYEWESLLCTVSLILDDIVITISILHDNYIFNQAMLF